jgi:transposase InsO family protein
VLEQVTADGQKPVAYASRALNPAEQNYTVTERENLALVYCLQEWQYMLEGSPHPVQCYTDHSALLSLLSKKVLSRREARWISEMSAFDLRIAHIEGKSNAVADPLSRRPDYEQLIAPAAVGAPQGVQLALRFGLLDSTAAQLAAAADSTVASLVALLGGAQHSTPWGTTAVADQPGPSGPTQQQKAPSAMVAAAVAVSADTAFKDALLAAYAADPRTAAVIRRLAAGEQIPPRNGQRWVLRDGLLYQVKGQQQRLFLPADQQLQLQVLQEFHEEPSAGHKGFSKTLARIKQHYTWKGITRHVRQYCSTCPVCQACKARNTKPAGQAQPLYIPDRPWQSVSLDLITQLPRSNGHTAIVVFVDRFSKQAHFAATTTKVTAPQLADLFIRTVYCHHGLPKDLVSDRDTRFVSDFWASLCKQLQVKRRLSTANHPQTDGQTERVNRILEEFLRAYCSARQDNWSQLLPMAEFAYNSSVQQSTGFAPFQLVYGSVPASPADLQAEALQAQQQQPELPHQPVQRPRQEQPQPAVQQPAAGGQQQQQPQPPLQPQRQPSHQRGTNRAAEQLVEQLAANWQLAKQRIAEAQQKQAETHNHRHSSEQFQAGDLVSLNVAHLRSSSPKHGSWKLHKKWLGPYKILRMHGPNAAELELPATMKIHPTVNISMLQKFRQSADFGQRTEPPPDPVLVEGQEEFEVEDILDRRVRTYGKGQREEYLVLWKGYPVWEATWEPKANLANAAERVHAFHQRMQSTASLLCLLHAS